MDSGTSEQLLTREAQPELDKQFPPCNFMTVYHKLTGVTTLVATRKNITHAPMFKEFAIEDKSYLQPTAKVLADALALSYEQDKTARFIQAYHTPEEWDKLKEAERVLKQNELVKPSVRTKKRRK